MDAPISSPIAARHSSSTISTASQSSPSQQFAPPRPPPSRQAGTEPFLRDFNLVAEAAKRAQMACLMRDMESCGLSPPHLFCPTNLSSIDLTGWPFSLASSFAPFSVAGA
ncbi:hypothetical protein AB5N19_08912 [Seiridium cardinale]|uniref:Uncharacterized protein n=1 Tax=Seiridium cardinale TaxID=138064 RepID=A0ABR2X7D0_9PEZI